jgi:hypothetical protein
MVFILMRGRRIKTQKDVSLYAQAMSQVSVPVRGRRIKTWSGLLELRSGGIVSVPVRGRRIKTPYCYYI